MTTIKHQGLENVHQVSFNNISSSSTTLFDIMLTDSRHPLNLAIPSLEL